MNWIVQHWQTIAALTIVAVATVALVWRLCRKKKNCGGGCGCGVTK